MFLTPLRTRLQVIALAATILFAALATPCSAAVAEDSIRLTPETLTNGAPCLITVLQDGASRVTGTWQGHPVAFFPGSDHRTWFALAGVDVEATPGNYPLTIDATFKDSTH